MSLESDWESATPIGSAPAAKTAEQPAVESEHPNLAFVSGNVNKGLATLAGLPVDTARNVINLGIAGYGTLKGAMGGTPPDVIEPGVGSSQWFEAMGKKSGMIPKEAEPESAGGKYAAAALQALPSALIGRPSLQQLPRAATTAMTSGVGAQLGADIAPEGQESAGAVVGSLLPGARRMGATPTVAERATTERLQALFAKAKELGVPIPPRLMKPDKPQQRLQDALNRELKNPPGTELSPPVLDNLIGAHYQTGYQPVINEPGLNGLIIPNQRFNQAINKIEQSEAQLRKEFPESTKDSGVQAIINDLRQRPVATGQPGVMSTIEKTATEQPGPPIMRTIETAASQTPGPKSYGEGSPAPAQAMPIAGSPVFTTDGVIQQIKRLRESATNNLNSPSATDDTIRLGRHQRKIANTLENLVEDNLAQINKPDLLKQFQDSRKTMAQAYNVKASIDPATGKINPTQLARLQSEGAPLTGELKNIAEVSKAFPKAVKSTDVSDDLFAHRMSPWAVTHPPSLAAHLMTRLLDPVTTSRPYQAAFVNPANRLTPDQQRLMRLLIGVRQMGNNGE